QMTGKMVPSLRTNTSSTSCAATSSAVELSIGHSSICGPQSHHPVNPFLAQTINRSIRTRARVSCDARVVCVCVCVSCDARVSCRVRTYGVEGVVGPLPVDGVVEG